MLTSKCPGQDTRYWTAEDIHEQPCPYCGAAVEFLKTDLQVRCPHCKKKVVNQKFNLGCAQWCAYAEQCLGVATGEKAPRPLRRILEQELTSMFNGAPLQLKSLREKLKEAEVRSLKINADPLPVLIALVVVGAEQLDRLKNAPAFLSNLVEKHRFPAEAVEEAKELIKKHGVEAKCSEKESMLADLLSGVKGLF